MRERFPADAATYAYLGASLQFQGRTVDSLPLFQQAFKLNPELPEARVAVALDLIRRGQVDEAHKLLKFLEAPNAPQFPGALYALANGHQRAGRHKEALALYYLLIERFPKLAQDKQFRAAVKISETASSTVAPSRLPARKIRWKPIITLGCVTLAALAIALGSNYYISRHRKLYLVSGFSRPVTIEIAGRPRETAHIGGYSTIDLPEGTYHAVISGAMQSQMDFTIASGFWARWFKNPAYILNPGGSALLMLENTTYSADKNGSADGFGFSFCFGQPFFTVPDVDYPFEEFPESITVDSHYATVHKSRISAFDGQPENAFFALVGKARYSEAFPLAEWYLSSHPDDAGFLGYYIYTSRIAAREPACRAFLAEGAKRRPIEITWHRAYQETRAFGSNAPALIAEYDSLLKAEPDNSDLLYLRGRLCASGRESTAFCSQAIARDPNNAFAQYAIGMDETSVGNWSDALLHLAEAVRLRPAELQFQEAFFNSQLALKKFEEAEAFLRANPAKDTANFLAAHKLGLLFALQGRTEDLNKLIASYRREVQSSDGTRAALAVAEFQASFLYAAGDFDALEKLLRNLKGVSPERFYALVELGRLQEAAEMIKPPHDSPPNIVNILSLCAAWKNAGNEVEAAACRDQAVQVLARGRIDEMPAAQFLKRDQPTPLDEIMDLPILPSEKALLLVVQAQRFQKNNAPLLAAARKLNALPQFPYHLLNRLTAPAGNGG